MRSWKSKREKECVYVYECVYVCNDRVRNVQRKRNKEGRKRDKTEAKFTEKGMGCLKKIVDKKEN